MKTVASRLNESERFWAKVDQSGKCWNWTGYTMKSGYGVFTAWADGKWTKPLAHRYAYKASNGVIPAGLVIDHMCHNTSCVRPEHLRAITQKQNCENRAGATRANAASRVRGVQRSRSGKRWVACLGHNHEYIYLGTYDAIAEAEAVVTAKRLELFTHNDTDKRGA